MDIKNGVTISIARMVAERLGGEMPSTRTFSIMTIDEVLQQTWQDKHGNGVFRCPVCNRVNIVENLSPLTKCKFFHEKK